MSILDLFELLADPERFVALGDLRSVFTGIIRGDSAVLSDTASSAVLSDANGWSALGTVLGAVGSTSGS